MDNIRKAVWLVAAALSTPALAQFSFPGSNGIGIGNGNGFGNGNGNGFGNAFGGFGGFSFDRQRVAHGILASVAFVGIFPLGAIAMTLIRGRWAMRVHALIQMGAFVLFIAGAALGFKMVREVNFRGAGGGFFLTNPNINYHPIIGIVLFILVIIQPVLGWLHHRNFVKYQRRTLVSYLHLFNGRVLIILGIVNGGLGLRVSRGSSHRAKQAYTIVAAVIGGLWLLVTVVGEIRKSRARDVSGRGAGDSGDHVKNVRAVKKTKGGEGGGSEQPSLYA